MKLRSIFIISIFFFHLFFFLAQPKPLIAQDIPRPYPSPTPIPCDDVGDGDGNRELTDFDFHSLRPYQASPCLDPTDTALFCGNDLVIEDTFTVEDAGPPLCTGTACGAIAEPPSELDQLVSASCAEPNTSTGIYRCQLSFSRRQIFQIDLQRAKLPILGNTQDVRNSQENDFPVDERLCPEGTTGAQDTWPFRNPECSDIKVNEYVSWYLNGVLNRAEYPYPSILDPQSPAIKTLELINPEFTETLLKNSALDEYKLVNLSGPLNKLLPQRVQWNLREGQIDAAEQTRHNQVVGCAVDVNINDLARFFPGGFLIPEGIGRTQVPIHCYDDSGFLRILDAAPGITFFKMRLSDWTETHRPPNEDEYTDLSAYWKDYLEWRGNKCFVLPLPGEALPDILLCYNDGGRVDSYAQLFPYIPYSSTEDLEGSVDFGVSQYNSLLPNPTNARIVERSITGDTSSDLFFAHTQESLELADTLQQSYVPKDLNRNAPPQGTPFNGVLPFCEITAARVNPGDPLFGEELDNTQLNFTAAFQCDFSLDPMPDPPGACEDAAPIIGRRTVCPEGVSPPDPRCTTREERAEVSCGLVGSCSDVVMAGACEFGFDCGVDCAGAETAPVCEISSYHAMSAVVNAPNMDEIWHKLVSGTSGVVRRWLPKLGSDAPVSIFLDSPGVTRAVYATDNDNISLIAGSPSRGRAGNRAEIYIPHLGGIHQYFLNCMQHMLRPQGFGSGCDSDSAWGGFELPIGNLPPIDALCEPPTEGPLTEWGLPAPVKEGPTGYQTFLTKIIRDTNRTQWMVSQMMTGEKAALAKGLFQESARHMVTAWLWFENGSSSYPDVYSINCNDNRPGYQSTVSFFCNVSNFQIAGYQAAGKDYQATFTTLYGSTPSVLQDKMRNVISNSDRASRATWNYKTTTGGLMAYLPAVNSTTVTDLGTTGEILNDGRTQFLSLIAGKDPAMVAAFNFGAVNGNLRSNLTTKSPPPTSRYTGPGQCSGTSCANCTYGYICGVEEQLLANIYMAIKLYDTCYANLTTQCQ